MILFSRLIFMFFLTSQAQGSDKKTLHLCSWWGMFPPAILKSFEAETGINVRNDLMDTNEILEAKLSAGRSGYDLVTPSFLPYGVRQIQGNLYKALDKKQLSHWQQIDPGILNRMTQGDPDNTYSVPIIWGVVGLAYDETKLKALFPQAPLNSWKLMFDPDVIKYFKGCRVTILDEVSDVIIPALLGFGMPLTYNTKEIFQEIERKLLDIRPFISRLDSLRSADDLVAKNICMAMQWTGGIEHARAKLADPSQADSIKTVIPQEGTVMWIDTLMIPVDAPNAEAAHAFIDYVLRPDIMAVITNQTHYANTVPASLPFIEEAIKNYEAIYPPASLMAKVHMNNLEPPSITRQINRLMTNFRRGKS